MAFERLGIELVVKGASDFARDLAHITMGLNRYISSVKRAADASKRAADKETRAQARIVRAVNSTKRVFTRHQDIYKHFSCLEIK